VSGGDGDQPRTHKVARVGDGQVHADVIALPDWHFVLADDPLPYAQPYGKDVFDTITYTETLPVVGPLRDRTPKKLTQKRKINSSDPRRLQDDGRFYWYEYAITVDGSTVSLSFTRGASTVVLFEDLPASALQKDETSAPAKRPVRMGAAIVYQLPRPRQHADKTLDGNEVHYNHLDVEEPKVEP
jgi:hypothetical protein